MTGSVPTEVVAVRSVGTGPACAERMYDLHRWVTVWPQIAWLHKGRPRGGVVKQTWGQNNGGVVGRKEPETPCDGRDDHSHTARSSLPRSVLAPGAARDFVRANLCYEHASRALGTVTLAASEFATQAVLGGSGPLTISLECDTTTVTLSVRYRLSAAVSRHSRGLADELSSQIIEGISRVAGAETANDGERRLWCTIPTGYITLATAPVRPDIPGQPGPQAPL